MHVHPFSDYKTIEIFLDKNRILLPLHKALSGTNISTDPDIIFSLFTEDLQIQMPKEKTGGSSFINYTLVFTQSTINKGIYTDLNTCENSTFFARAVKWNGEHRMIGNSTERCRLTYTDKSDGKSSDIGGISVEISCTSIVPSIVLY